MCAHVLAEDALNVVPGLGGDCLQAAVNTVDHTQPTAGLLQSVLPLSTVRSCSRGTVNSGVCVLSHFSPILTLQPCGL